ncbi:hypothetical protein GCM10010431_64470 [Streptomyces kunmingensis]
MTSSTLPVRLSGVSRTFASRKAEGGVRGGGHLGVDEPGMDGVHPDPARPELQCRGAGQATKRPFAGGKGDRVGRGERGRGAHVEPSVANQLWTDRGSSESDPGASNLAAT